MKKNNKKIVFNLGPTPVFFYPNVNPFDGIYQSIYCGCSHAVIYNRNVQNDLIYNMSNKNIKHWDVFINKEYYNYFYIYPLCYQTFPITDNQKYWYSSNSDELRAKILKSVLSN